MAQSKKNKQQRISSERGKGLCASSFFSNMLTKAARVLGAPGKIYVLLANAYKKTDNINTISGVTHKLKTQIVGLYDLVVDYVKGEYTQLELKDATLIVAGIIYLVSPLDFVPDFIPFVGLLDDISILSWIISTLNEEIDAYLIWKNHGIIKSQKETEAKEPLAIELQ